jgi:formylglycine-generating enzyme required for sulfatase activity
MTINTNLRRSLVALAILAAALLGYLAWRQRQADDVGMVHVPGGTFQMGGDESNPYVVSDEFPKRTVTLGDFWIDQTETTNAQFAAFLNARGNQTEGGVTWLNLEDQGCQIEQVGGKYRPKSGYADHPVIDVSWYGAEAYCKWAGARLPTEAEWEYAARGSQDFTYPWGDSFPACELAQFSVCSGQTIAVGSLLDGASWCGVHDMAGNVWEWVADWYGDYAPGAQTNPTGPVTGESKVLRGGSFTDLWHDIRVAYRYGSNPSYRLDSVGFRCAKSTPGG